MAHPRERHAHAHVQTCLAPCVHHRPTHWDRTHLGATMFPIGESHPYRRPPTIRLAPSGGLLALDPTRPLTFMSVNTQRGGVLTTRRTPDNRLPALCDSINAHAPHLVGVQEADEWAKDDHKHLREVEQRLGLTALEASFIPNRSTGVLYDPAVMELVEWEPAPGVEWQGFTGTALFDVGQPYKLAVAVVHLSHQSAPWALHQASLVNDRTRRLSDRRQPPGKPHAEAAVVFGDVNQPALHHPDAPPDPHPDDLPACNLAYRFKGMPGEEEVDREVSALFARCRWTDVALDAAQRSPDPAERTELLKDTGAGGFRVDRVYVTESVAPAVSAYGRVPIRSDHDALVWTLTPASIDPAATTTLHR